MEKLYFLLLAWELIYEVLRTTPFPGYAEVAVANLSGGLPGRRLRRFFRESIISDC